MHQKYISLFPVLVRDDERFDCWIIQPRKQDKYLSSLESVQVKQRQIGSRCIGACVVLRLSWLPSQYSTGMYDKCNELPRKQAQQGLV